MSGSVELTGLLRKCRGLRWLHVLGTGVDEFPFERAGGRRITCSRGATAVPIAEWVKAMMLTFEKQLPASWLVSTYPAWLTEAALAYWRGAGIDVAEVAQIEADTADTRNVYNLGSADAVAAARRLQRRDVDALLLSGTGMPTLRAIGELTSFFGKPILSSNLCLGFALANRIRLRAAPPWEQRADWEPLLDRL